MATDDHGWRRRLWAQHSGPVYACAARRVGRERAEDVLTECSGGGFTSL